MRRSGARIFVDGKSIKQICRELRLSRNTVRKVIRSGTTEFTYDRTTQPRPKIDPWRAELNEMLAAHARRSKATREASASAYVPLSFDPGEAYQFDWSHEVMILDGCNRDGQDRPCPPLPQPDAVRPG